MLLGECEGVGGLQEEQANTRKGNGVRQGPDDESSQVTVGSGFYPDGRRQATDTARDPQQENNDQTHALERTVAAGSTVG